MDNWRESLIRRTGGEWHEAVDIRCSGHPTNVNCKCKLYPKCTVSRPLSEVEEAVLDSLGIKNPTLAHVDDIKARLQQVPCGECGGSGLVHCSDSIDMCDECGNEGARRCYAGKTTCPTCKGNKTVDLWEEFAEWHDRMCHANVVFTGASSWAKGHKARYEDIIQPAIHASADILTDVELCGPAADAFMKEREK